MKITDDKKVKADLLMASLLVRDVTSDWYKWAICIDLLWICLLLWSHGFSVCYKLSPSKIYGKEHLSSTDGTCNQRFMPCLLWERKQFGRGPWSWFHLLSVPVKTHRDNKAMPRPICSSRCAYLSTGCPFLSPPSKEKPTARYHYAGTINERGLCTWKAQLVFVMIIFGVWCLAQTL